MNPDDARLRDRLLDLRDAGDLVAMVVAETDRATYADSPTGSLALERAVGNFGEAASRLHGLNPDFDAHHSVETLLREIDRVQGMGRSSS